MSNFNDELNKSTNIQTNIISNTEDQTSKSKNGIVNGLDTINTNESLNENKQVKKIDAATVTLNDISIDSLLATQTKDRTLTNTDKKSLSKKTPESLEKLSEEPKDLAQWCRYHLETKGDDHEKFAPIANSLTNVVDLMEGLKDSKDNLWERSDIDDVCSKINTYLNALEEGVKEYKSTHSQHPFFKKGKMRSKLCWDILTSDYISGLKYQYDNEAKILYKTSIDNHIVELTKKKLKQAGISKSKNKKTFDEKLDEFKKDAYEEFRAEWIERKKKSVLEKDPNKKYNINEVTYEMRMKVFDRSIMLKHYGLTEPKTYLKYKDIAKNTSKTNIDRGVLGILKPVLFDVKGNVMKGYEANDAWNKAWLHGYKATNDKKIINNRMPFFVDIMEIVKSVTLDERKKWNDKDYYLKNKDDIDIKTRALLYYDNLKKSANFVQIMEEAGFKDLIKSVDIMGKEQLVFNGIMPVELLNLYSFKTQSNTIAPINEKDNEVIKETKEAVNNNVFNTEYNKIKDKPLYSPTKENQKTLSGGLNYFLQNRHTVEENTEIKHSNSPLGELNVLYDGFIQKEIRIQLEDEHAKLRDVVKSLGPTEKTIVYLKDSIENELIPLLEKKEKADLKDIDKTIIKIQGMLFDFSKQIEKVSDERWDSMNRSFMTNHPELIVDMKEYAAFLLESVYKNLSTYRLRCCIGTEISDKYTQDPSPTHKNIKSNENNQSDNKKKTNKNIYVDKKLNYRSTGIRTKKSISSNNKKVKKEAEIKIDINEDNVVNSEESGENGNS